jgi:hypothetical protein
MCRPRRVRVTAALSAGGGGGPAGLISAAVASRSPMSEPPDALDLSTERLLPKSASSAPWPRLLNKEDRTLRAVLVGMVQEGDPST